MPRRKTKPKEYERLKSTRNPDVMLCPWCEENAAYVDRNLRTLKCRSCDNSLDLYMAIQEKDIGIVDFKFIKELESIGQQQYAADFHRLYLDDLRAHREEKKRLLKRPLKTTGE